MLLESHDLDRFEIFYEEVGTSGYNGNVDFEDPSIFLEEVELSPAQGLNAEDLPLLTQDLDTPNRFDNQEDTQEFE